MTIQEKIEKYNQGIPKRYDMVMEFHRAMGLPINFVGTWAEHEKLKKLRLSVINEEALELHNEVRLFETHSDSADICSLAKEIADFEYVIFGTAISFGFEMPVFVPIYDKIPLSLTPESMIYAMGFVFTVSNMNETGINLLDKYDEIFAEVHRSNMSKLGDDGKPVLREDGKVMKGPNFSPADLSFLKQ